MCHLIECVSVRAGAGMGLCECVCMRVGGCVRVNVQKRETKVQFLKKQYLWSTVKQLSRRELEKHFVHENKNFIRCDKATSIAQQKNR